MPPMIKVSCWGWVGLILAMLAIVMFLTWYWPGLVVAEGTIASDHFEGNSFSGGTGWLTSWNTSGAVDLVREQNPHSGSHHLRLRGAAGATRTVDLSGWNNVELSFWARVSSFEAKDGDSAVVEVSTDAGTSWEVLESWQDGDDDHHYWSYEFDLSEMNLTGTILIRFVASMNGPDDYLFIDDVRFQGEAAPGGEIPPNPPLQKGGTDGGPPLVTEGEGDSIVVDGVFGDWAGRAHLPDPSGDADKARGDLATFYWANNASEESNYWMIERYPADEADEDDREDDDSPIKRVRYTIYLDTDDDGIFTERADRRVIVDYKPQNDDSVVRVRVRQGRGSATISSSQGDWGESKAEGGQRVEFGVPFADLGISAGSVIRMYLESDRNDRVPDRGDIQWSPASILGYWLLGTVLVGGAVAFWYIRRNQEKRCPSGQP